MSSVGLYDFIISAGPRNYKCWGGAIKEVNKMCCRQNVIRPLKIHNRSNKTLCPKIMTKSRQTNNCSYKHL